MGNRTEEDAEVVCDTCFWGPSQELGVINSPCLSCDDGDSWSAMLKNCRPKTDRKGP
jgi:hypothetical protein